MLSAKYTTPNGRLTVEFEAGETKEVFAQLAELQEAFEEPECGLCGSEAIRHDVREFNRNRYFKLVCERCGAQLDYGQHREAGSLYPKRMGQDDKTPQPFAGWYVHHDDDPRLAHWRQRVRTAADESALRAAWDAMPADLRRLLDREKNYRKQLLADQRAATPSR